MPEKGSSFVVEVMPLQDSDVNQLEFILMQRVVDNVTGEQFTNEINQIMGYMRGWKDSYGRTRKYFVAKDQDGKVLGCMAYSIPDSDMSRHFRVSSSNTVEILNAFVSEETSKKGIGRALFNTICDEVEKNGVTRVTVNSGPRYEKSWGFYDNVCDMRTGILENKYGEGRHAQTWVRFLK